MCLTILHYYKTVSTQIFCSFLPVSLNKTRYFYVGEMYIKYVERKTRYKYPLRVDLCKIELYNTGGDSHKNKRLYFSHVNHKFEIIFGWRDMMAVKW